MNISVMNCFLSEDNIKRHIEYMNQLKLRLSVYQKCYPEYFETQKGILRHKSVDRRDKDEVKKLVRNINSHELFFASFSHAPRQHKKLRKYYTSAERLCYDVCEASRSVDFGFLYINLRRNVINISTDYSEETSILAIDLCEHAYFADYGYCKEKYIKNALFYLDINQLESKLT